MMRAEARTIPAARAPVPRRFERGRGARFRGPASVSWHEDAKLTRAPGNNAPIGGLKVVAASGWFAARPSGTENVYKLYAESFKSPEHLERIVEQARDIVGRALGAARPPR